MKKMFKHINYIIALASAVVMGACAEVDLEEASEHATNHIPRVTIQSPLGGVNVETGDEITFIRVIADKDVFVKRTYTGTPDTIKFGANDLHGADGIKKYGYPGEYRVFLTHKAKGISLTKEGLFKTNVTEEKSAITGESTLFLNDPHNNAETIRLYETGIINMVESKDYSSEIKFVEVGIQEVGINLSVNSPIAVKKIEAEITGIPTSFAGKYIKRDEFATAKLSLDNMTVEGNKYSVSDTITVPTVYCENTDDMSNVIKVKITLDNESVVTCYLNTWRVINKNYLTIHHYGEDLYKYSDNEEYLISTTKKAELNFSTISIIADDNGSYFLKAPKTEDASSEWQSLK